MLQLTPSPRIRTVLASALGFLTVFLIQHVLRSRFNLFPNSVPELLVSMPVRFLAEAVITLHWRGHDEAQAFISNYDTRSAVVYLTQAIPSWFAVGGIFGGLLCLSARYRALTLLTQYLLSIAVAVAFLILGRLLLPFDGLPTG